MKKKFKLPTISILLIFILSACSNDELGLDGSWKLISEEHEEVEMYIHIDGIKGDAVYMYDGEPTDEVEHTILSAKDENQYFYAFEFANEIKFNFEGYFQDKNNFIAESSYGDYFRLERMGEKELRSEINELYRQKAVEHKREEKETAYENEDGDENYDWDYNEENEDLETTYEEENEEDEPEPTLSAAEDAYRASCASCHGQDLTGGAGPDLTKVGRHLNSREIRRIIEEGQASMPGGLLIEDDARLVAEWLSRKH